MFFSMLLRLLLKLFFHKPGQGYGVMSGEEFSRHLQRRRKPRAAFQMAVPTAAMAGSVLSSLMP